jgi:ribosomal-protein-alanine N-acetyltransferase
MKDLSNTIIETDRLILKPISLEFAQDMFNEFNEEVTHYMYPKPASKISDTIEYITNTQEEIKKGKDLTMCIILKKTGEYLGTAGIHNIDSTIPELGIWIKKSAHGNKYGREALQGAKNWADKNLKYKYIIYPVAKDNIPSRKIAESLGGIVKKEYPKKMLTGKTWDMVEYHIPKTSI